MWQKFKKSVGKKPKSKSWLTSEMKVIGWCLENNISISCMHDWKNNGDGWVIDIKINKNEDETVLNKIYEYYKYYYDKHRK